MDSASLPQVSVILPILNEARDLVASISAILRQDYPPGFEVILALGPSKDDTNRIATELAAKDARIILVDNPTGRTANGLNAAISKSRYPIISRIDGHAEVSNTYLRDAVEILLKTQAVNVGGIMAAEGKTNFEKAVATAMRSPLGVGAARFHTGGSAGPSDTVYLGTFLKSALVAAGGYDERFTRAQDWELNFRLRAAGGIVWFDPSLLVTYRPRPNLRALAKQYFEYGTWRRVVTRSHKGSVNYRYLAPPVAVVLNLISLVLGATLNSIFLLPILCYLLLILLGSLRIGKSALEKLFLPPILITMHMVWGAGFLTSPKRLMQQGK
ncbi:MAG: glycosyltransferase family 2 protein [Actinobacteria bacterium]|nr:glycosyltransferase family 2 protein [Actinomycetota bacterium]